MKTKFIITAVVTSLSLNCALGQERDWQRELIYGLDFNGALVDDQISLNNVAEHTSADTTDFTVKGTSGNVNYTSDIIGGSSTLYGHAVHGKSFELADSNGIGGISADRGFSMVFAAHNNTIYGWNDILNFTYGGVNFQFRFAGTDGMFIVTEGGNISYGGTGMNQEWATYGVNVLGDTLTFIAITEAGDYYSSSTTIAAPAAGEEHLLTSVYGGSNVTTHLGSNTQLDNFAIYNGILEEKHLQQINASNFTSSSLLQYVPEPSTATLSLFALAGLMARRRRK